MRRLDALILAVAPLVATSFALPLGARQAPIPHGQKAPPGPALSPEEAIRKMTVPEGFTVELVASEPNLVNPVAMTFDDRGRIWVTESLEYPRSSPGPGRDRVKVLEDTDGDGKADKFTIFAEGLNIPSGIAVGHGGVWVANAPDILFLKDTDGDGKADTREVVVTGFGRDDTHELPNSLTWGPDGWLYGWNGVFNHSLVKHRGKEYKFTCAIFRIHPKTREFQLWCEGTSNPWGIAIDPEGSFFASACVIDHLWHLVETGYYHRQGGPYPPFTWKIESIVDFKHQQAAYCGITYYDSDAYPEPYRDRLYMGNIHANGINVDTIVRNGSTYRGENAPDFLLANDAWFMPVSQKTGPDGCLYILDWYDRYHCYQDARRDPEGIDRLKGRLYRVRYKDTPRQVGFDLAKETDEQLVDRLKRENSYFREQARRLLTERATPEAQARLKDLIFDGGSPRKARMNALWALVSIGDLEPEFHLRLLTDNDPGYRAWAVRAAGNMKRVDPTIRDLVARLVGDASPDVLLQVAIASRKVEGLDPLPLLLQVLKAGQGDPLIPRVVWQNLHPLLEGRPQEFVKLAVGRATDLSRPGVVTEVTALGDGVETILPRVVERLLGASKPDVEAVARIVGAAIASRSPAESVAQALAILAKRIQNGEIGKEQLEFLRKRLTESILRDAPPARDGRLWAERAVLGATFAEPAAIEAARSIVTEKVRPEGIRLQALDALLHADDRAKVLDVSRNLLADRQGNSADFRGKILGAMGKLDHPEVASIVLEAYPDLEPEVRPRAVELLTGRAAWARPLLAAVALKRVPHDALNVNQLRKLLQSQDPEILAQVKATWGTLREGRNPAREQVVARMRDHVRRTPGDPFAGRKIFERVCGQCHKLYGEGQEVGPELTGVGRSDLEQLISNVFDPSLVIGTSYQSTVVATKDGRVLNGLLVEDTPQRVVLKTQGGKIETIPRAEVDERKLSELSLMPEDLESQINPQEIADLFAFLGLDKPPTDPTARRLPGLPEPRPRPLEGDRR